MVLGHMKTTAFLLWFKESQKPVETDSHWLPLSPFG